VTSRACPSEGADDGVDGSAEFGAIPPVGEQVDVFAHSLDEAVHLEGVPAGEGEAVLVEYSQCQPDQTVLQLVHA
jgi:hypothetical protein